MATASERTIVKNPNLDDPNAGIIIAAGDEIPGGAVVSGYIDNTPNKVDAASNYDDVDAADKARTRPTEIAPADVWGPPVDRAELEAAHERVAENREEFEQRQANELAPSDAPATGDALPEGKTNFADFTVPELDAYAERYGKPDGYSGNKTEKVNALKKAYSDGPAAGAASATSGD